MTALTATQIRSGMKTKAVDLGPAAAPIQRLDLSHIGPCAACHGHTLRYGDHGRPLCNHCQPHEETKT